MSLVGIIANPDSGKDIRRLVSQAVVVDNVQKLSIVKRLLLALEEMGVEEVSIMPDYFGIGLRALDVLTERPRWRTRATLIDMPIEGTWQDSLGAAQRMRQAGAGCLIVLGGDGTCRVVSRGCGEVPLLPISTGTNNVVPFFVEGTIAGLAGGYVAARGAEGRDRLCWRHKRLVVRVNGEEVDHALVDVAHVAAHFIGARAVWEPEALRQVFVTRAQPSSTGLSAVVGMLQPVSPRAENGAAIKFSPKGRCVLVPLAPGLIKRINVGDVSVMKPDVVHPVTCDGPSVLALDGEREIVLHSGDQADVTLCLDGPWLVDIDQALRQAVFEGCFVR